jgi:hypothetical protein
MTNFIIYGWDLGIIIIIFVGAEYGPDTNQ